MAKDSPSPVLTAARLQPLAKALEWQASENGCYGEYETNCTDAHPDEPGEWCPYCLMGRAARVLPDLLALVTAPPPDVCACCGYSRDQHSAYQRHEHSQAMPGAPPICSEFQSQALVTAPEREPGWRPIDTAPKDRTVIIGALITDGTVWRVSEMKHNGLAFYTVSGGMLPPMTHWIPMPGSADADHIEPKMK